MKLRWILAGSLVASAALIAAILQDHTPTRSEYCTAKVGTTVAQIDLEQAQWTSLMAAIGIRRGLPPRATSIAITTAFQESKIHNLDYGDRDSVGLFQQRPSQGWGTRRQILDPNYAIERFFDALVKVKGYQSMDINEAAQRVQRSGHPGAYAKHENYARALASALTGYSPGEFSCQINPRHGGNAQVVESTVDRAFGKRKVQVNKDSITFMTDGEPANKRARGWALAHFLVAHAANLKLDHVAFDGRKWTAEKSPKGWRPDPNADLDAVTVRVG